MRILILTENFDTHPLKSVTSYDKYYFGQIDRLKINSKVARESRLLVMIQIFVFIKVKIDFYRFLIASLF